MRFDIFEITMACLGVAFIAAWLYLVGEDLFYKKKQSKQKADRKSSRAALDSFLCNFETGSRISSEEKEIGHSKDKADWLYDMSEVEENLAKLGRAASFSSGEIEKSFKRLNGNGPLVRIKEEADTYNATSFGRHIVDMSDYTPARTPTPDPLSARTCPNCGAPVRGYKCEYCDSVFETPGILTLNLDMVDFDRFPMMTTSAACIGGIKLPDAFPR